MKKEQNDNPIVTVEREQFITSAKEEAPKLEDAIQIENIEVQSRHQTNIPNEVYCKSTNSEDLIYKNNIINYQALNNIGLSKNKPTKEYLSNDLIYKPTTKSIGQEKSVKREKGNLEVKSSSGSSSKIEEMRKLLDVGTEREK
jgi:hypothetical protein